MSEIPREKSQGRVLVGVLVLAWVGLAAAGTALYVQQRSLSEQVTGLSDLTERLTAGQEQLRRESASLEQMLSEVSRQLTQEAGRTTGADSTRIDRLLELAAARTDSLSSQLEAQGKEVRDLAKTLADMKAAHATALAEDGRRLQALGEQLAETRKMLTDRAAAQTTLADGFDQARKDLTAVRTGQDNLGKDLASLRTAHEGLATDLEGLRGSPAQQKLIEQIDALKAGIAQLEKHLAELRLQVESLSKAGANPAEAAKPSPAHEAAASD